MVVLMGKGTIFRRLLYASFKVVFYLGRWVREKFTPAGLLLISCMIIAGIFGVDLKHTLSYQLFTLTAALIFISIIASWRFTARFNARRQLPDYGTVGEELRYTISVHNNNAATQRELLVSDHAAAPFPSFNDYLHAHDPKDASRNWFDRLVGYPRLMGIMQKNTGASTEVAQLQPTAAFERQQINMRLQPVRRGYVYFTHISIGRPDPLGIYQHIKKIPAPGALLVLPKRYRLSTIPLFGQRKYQHGGVTQASAVGDSQEFLSLRDYRAGDPLRAIHWRSFAKLGKPIVREYQDEFYVRQALLLDTWLADQPEVIFEEAVSVAASFTLRAFDTDALLDLLFVGAESFRFTCGRGVSQAENMLEILACVQPCQAPPFQSMQQLVLETCAESSGLICILLDWDEQRQGLISKALGMAIPLHVFVLRTAEQGQELDYGPLAEQPQRLTVIPVDKVQATLDALTL